MWEKQSFADGSIHDIENRYTWDSAFAAHIGTLNRTKFAGHTNWRVPNYKELVGILDLGTFNPAVSPAFNNHCSGLDLGPCTVLTCSCTALTNYWTPSSLAFFPASAWVVDFDLGFVGLESAYKGLYCPAHYPCTQGLFPVRAVRGGS